MFEFSVLPRLSETDGVGHINNTFLPAWFEEARRDLYKLLNPGLTLESWNYEIEFINQIAHDEIVTIKTFVERIGGKSIIVYQEASQNGQLVVSASTVLVYFDFKAGATTEIPEVYKAKLSEHLRPSQE